MLCRSNGDADPNCNSNSDSNFYFDPDCCANQHSNIHPDTNTRSDSNRLFDFLHGGCEVVSRRELRGKEPKSGL